MGCIAYSEKTGFFAVCNSNKPSSSSSEINVSMCTCTRVRPIMFVRMRYACTRAYTLRFASASCETRSAAQRTSYIVTRVGSSTNL